MKTIGATLWPFSKTHKNAWVALKAGVSEAPEKILAWDRQVEEKVRSGTRTISGQPITPSPIQADITKKARIWQKGIATGYTFGVYVPPDEPTMTVADKTTQYISEGVGGLAAFATGAAFLKAELAAYAPAAYAKLFPSAAKLAAATAGQGFIKATATKFLMRIGGEALLFNAISQITAQDRNSTKERLRSFYHSTTTAAAFSAVPHGPKGVPLLLPAIAGIEAGFGAEPAEAWKTAAMLSAFNLIGGEGEMKIRERATIEARESRRARTPAGEGPFEPPPPPSSVPQTDTAAKAEFDALRSGVDIDAIKRGFDSEASRRIREVDADPNLTAEQKTVEKARILLDRDVSKAAALPEPARSEVEAKAAQEITSLLTSDTPVETGPVSRTARAAADALISSPVRVPTVGEPAIKLSTGGLVSKELPGVVNADIDRAIKEGALLPTASGSFVVAEGARAMISRVASTESSKSTERLIGEAIIVTPDGGAFNLGVVTGPGSGGVMNALKAVGHRGVEVTVERVVPGARDQGGQPTYSVSLSVPQTFLESSGQTGRYTPQTPIPPIRPALAEQALATLYARKPAQVNPAYAGQAVPIRPPGQLGYEFATRKPGAGAKEPPTASTSSNRAAARRELPPSVIENALTFDLKKGKLKTEVIDALSDTQLDQSVVETAVSRANPETAGDPRVMRDLREQMEALLVEKAGRLYETIPKDPEHPTIEEAEAVQKELNKLAVDAKISASAPYIDRVPIDPEVAKRIPEVKRRLGITDDVEALRQATSEFVAEAIAGVPGTPETGYARLRENLAPQPPARVQPPGQMEIEFGAKQPERAPAPRPKLPKHMQQFGAPEGVKPSDEVKVEPRTQEEIEAGARAAGEKLSNRGARKLRSPEEISELRTKLLDRATQRMEGRLNDLIRKKKEYYAIGENLRPIEEFESALRTELEHALKEAGGVGRQVIGKKSLSADPNYEGLTAHDISELRRRGMAHVADLVKESRSRHDRYSKAGVESADGTFTPSRDRMIGIEESRAMDKFDKLKKDKVISGTYKQFEAIKKFYDHNEIPSDVDGLWHLAEFNPEAAKAEKAFESAMVENPNILDTKNNRGSWMEAYVTGSFHNAPEIIANHPVIRERVADLIGPKYTSDTGFTSLRKPSADDLVYSKKDARTGEHLGYAPIKNNQLAFQLAKESKAAEGSDPLVAAAYRKVNNILVDKYPGYYELKLENPAAMFEADGSVLTNVELLAGEALAIQKAMASPDRFLLDTHTDPITQVAADIANRRTGKNPRKLKTNLSMDEYAPEEGGKVNIRNIVHEAVMEISPQGKALRRLAKTREEKTAVSEYMYTGDANLLPAKLARELEAYEVINNQLDTMRTAPADLHGRRLIKEVSDSGKEPMDIEDALDIWKDADPDGEIMEARLYELESGEKPSDALSAVKTEDMTRGDYSYLDLIMGSLKYAKELSPGEKVKAVDNAASTLSRLLEEAMEVQVQAEKIAGGRKKNLENDTPLIRTELGALRMREMSAGTSANERKNIRYRIYFLESRLRELVGGPGWAAPIPDVPAQRERMLKDVASQPPRRIDAMKGKSSDYRKYQNLRMPKFTLTKKNVGDGKMMDVNEPIGQDAE